MVRSLIIVAIAVLAGAILLTTNTKAISSVFAVVACATTAPCTGGNNTDGGAGVFGQSNSSHGVIGNSLFNSTGPSNGESAVFGQDLSRSGVYNMGVQGVSVRGYGLRGRSTSNVGARGDSTSNYGVEGTSSFGGVAGLGGTYGIFGSGVYGLYGSGTSYGTIGFGNAIGVYGSGSSSGVYAFSNSGTAVYASGNGPYAIQAHLANGTATGVLSQNTSATGRGADVSGGYVGLVTRSSTFPIVAVDQNGANEFYVDNAGNVYYHGSLFHFGPAGSSTVTAYTQAVAPAIEDTGTARLAMGAANVYLNPSFARSIDPRLGYQVFLTPGGDTRGLYVAAKYAGGFTVREVQGGRGTFNFDYHVYAKNAQPTAAAARMAPNLPPPLAREPTAPKIVVPSVRP